MLLGRDIAKGTHKRWQRANTRKGVAELGGPPCKSHSTMSSCSCPQPSSAVPRLPTACTAARTHFYEEQQANLTRETQPRALSWLRVHFKPKTQSQFRFLNFPVLVHVAVVEQDLAELVQVHPTNAGLQAKEKNIAERENSFGFPQPCKAAGCAGGGRSKEERPHGLTLRQLIQGGEVNREWGKDALQKQKRYGTVSNCKEMQHDFCA